MVYVGLALGATSWFAPILVRQGTIALSPPDPAPLGGYTARGSKPVQPGGDPLHAQAVLLEQGELRVAVVSCDLLTIPESLEREVRKLLPPSTRLFLVATHTHCAPDSQALNDQMTFALPGIAKFRPDQLDWYAHRIGDGLSLLQEMPATPIATFGVDFAHVSANRGRRQGAIPDDLAVRIWAKSPNPTIATKRLWFHYAAHAVFFGPERNQTSADWPGGAQVAIDTPAVLPGAIGDVSPAAEGATPKARIESFWANVRFRLLDDSGAARHSADLRAQRLEWTSEPIALDAVRAHPDFAKKNGIPDGMAQSIVSRFAPKRASINAFSLGKLCVVGVPGEPTAALGKRIRNAGRNLGFEWTLVVSHVNGWIGYILESDDYARGGYEASLAFHGPETANRIFAASLTAMKRLAQPKTQAQASRGVKSVSGRIARQ